MTALSLLPLLLVSAAPQDYAQPAPSDPPVRVWTDDDEGYAPGDLARVYVRAARDGYLVVLHADPNGTVRVLFPVDPVDDDFVRGGESLEVRGRGDREAFLVDEITGAGVVLAAWSEDPFRFGEFVRGDHWDYRVIAPDGIRGDLEAGLLDVVQRMSVSGDFDYDASPYYVRGVYREASSRVAVSVGTHAGVCVGCYGPRIWPRSGFSLSINIGSFGFDYWRYRPWYYDPWYHWSAWDYHFYRPYPVIWHRHRPVWVFDPFIWYRVPRHHYPRIGVRVHYAGCWGDPFCRGDRHWRSRPGIATGTVLAGDYGRGWGDGVWSGGRLSSGVGAVSGISTGRTARSRDGSFDGSATGRIGGVASDRSAGGRIGGSSSSSTDRSATGRIGGSSSSSTDRSATGRIGGSSSYDRGTSGRIGGSSSSGSSDRGATGRIGGSSSDRARVIAPSSSGRLRDSARPSGSARSTSERPSSRSGSISGSSRSSQPPASARSTSERSGGGSARASGRATSRGSSSGRSGRIGGN